jgi:AcrR family transcriptional regulator
MRRANTQRQSDRRAEILDAAKRCFARDGVHHASMQVICAEAGMSPGNLYRYFRSKEAIIAGIAERDRAEVAQQFVGVSQATDFFAAFEALARHHFAERPAEDVALCTELMAECRRNPEIAGIFRAFDADVRARLVAMLRDAAARGEIAPQADFNAVVTMLMVIADGVWCRRSSDPAFDPQAVLPMFMAITRHLLLGAPQRCGEAPGHDRNEESPR